VSLSLPVSFEQSRSWWRAFWRKAALILPKGLYARALLIVIVPMVILQCVLTFVFMERHWQLVTRRLSTALTQDIAAIVELHKSPGPDKRRGPRPDRPAAVENRHGILPNGELPPALPKPFFSILDAALSKRSGARSANPSGSIRSGARISSRSGSSSTISILRVVALRGAAYASNSQIFLLWMIGTSFVLIVAAIAFCATRSSRSFCLPARRKRSARGAILNFIRAARGRCARRATLSLR
jgi:two-component system osmolarity sensor histidine kinase EnvZ